MATVQVLFTLQGDADDPETGVSSTLTAPVPLTLAGLRDIFPYYGTYHFRLRIWDSDGAEYVWLDLVRENEDLVEIAADLGVEAGQSPRELEVKVLPLSFELTPEEEAQARLAELQMAGEKGGRPAVAEGAGVYQSGAENAKAYSSGQHPSYRDHNHNHQRGSSTSGNPSPHGHDAVDEQEGPSYGDRWRTRLGADNKILDDVQAGVKTVLGSKAAQDIRKTGANMVKGVGMGAKMLFKKLNQGGSAARGEYPSPDALESLHIYAALLAKPVGSEHADLMRELWDGLFPKAKGGYEVASPRWLRAGFQRQDPSQELRCWGLLTLKCMVYLCSSYGHKAQSMLEGQASKSDQNRAYPWAVVANNVVLMLAQVLSLKTQAFVRDRAVFWEVFAGPEAFYEVFCMVFRLLDHNWGELGATREKFGRVIGTTKVDLDRLLQTGPSSLEEFMNVALQSGLLY
ncbi:unnamed protein product [Chrysoparadoxa australica]